MTTPLRLCADIGQANDPSAIAAIHCVDQKYEIRQLGRIDLLTPYPTVAKIIVKAALAMRETDGQVKTRLALEASEAKGIVVNPEPADEVSVYVDATGVGAPIVDMIAEPLREAEIHLIPVVIAAGDEMKELVKEKRGHPFYRYVRVGKEYLIGRLQAMLQTQRLIGAPSTEFAEAKQQLLAFQRKTNERMHDTYNAKSGAHDDLVIALALGVLDEVPREDVAGLKRTNDLIPGYDKEIKMSESPSLFGWQF